MGTHTPAASTSIPPTVSAHGRGDAPRRPFGPHPVRHGGVKIPVRADWTFVYATVSTPDYKRAMAHPWRLDQHGYPCANVWDVKRKVSTLIYLHRVIANAPDGVLCDHKFGNILDARRCVLRLATPSENSANRRERKRHSSRYRGVVRHKTGKFQAQAKHGDRNFYLGLYASELDAAAAYNEKARELWGPFARLNRLPRQKVAA